MFFDTLGIPIRHQIQPDLMLKQRFEAREHQREPLSRASYLLHQLVSVAGEAGLRDTDERCAILLRRKRPLHGGGTTIPRPLDHDALIWFDGRRADAQFAFES